MSTPARLCHQFHFTFSESEHNFKEQIAILNGNICSL